MNYQKIEECYNLIAIINQGETINVNSMTISTRNSFFTAAYRWWYAESHDVLLKFLLDLEKSTELIITQEYKNNNKELLIKVDELISKSMIGFDNLIESYPEKKAFADDVKKLRDRLNVKCEELQKIIHGLKDYKDNKDNNDNKDNKDNNDNNDNKK
jgi:hypothetical protein